MPMFAGRPYTTYYRRDRVIAQQWLTANGLNDADQVREFLDTIAPTALAAECMEGWFSDVDDEDVDEAPTVEDLTARFAELAADRSWLD